MKELKKELQSNTVISTSEVFLTSAFREWALNNISSMYSQGVQLLVHNSVGPTHMDNRGKSVYWALRNFARMLVPFGQENKGRYINDLLLKVLTESHRHPITVITSSQEMAEKIGVIRDMESFEKNLIQIIVIDDANAGQPLNVAKQEQLSIESIKSLFNI